MFFGGLAFLVSVGTYSTFNVLAGLHELVANVFSWLITVLFAFVTNRVWVFKAGTTSVKACLTQMCIFYAGRVLTLAVEETILFIFITRLCFPSVPVKIAAQIIVILLNYVISKRLVFHTDSH